jgi:hypothetical protein
MKQFFFTVFLVTLVFNCKPNSKNEIQYWENNKKDFAEATTKYPNFKAVLEVKMKEAEALWEEAGKLTNEEQKAAKMKEANSKINELLNQFTQIKYKSEGILKSIDKIDDKKLSGSKAKSRNSAIDSGRKALAEVNTKMNTAVVNNEEEAKGVTKEVISILISAQGTLDRAIKEIKK